MSKLLQQSRLLAGQLRTVAQKKQEDAAWLTAAADALDRLVGAFERATRRTIESYEEDRQPVPNELRRPASLRQAADVPDFDRERLKNAISEIVEVAGLDLEMTEHQAGEYRVVKGKPE